MYCGEHSLVNEGHDGRRAVSLRCRAWTCEECALTRYRQLVALAKSGKPTRFITLTVNPSWGNSPEERAHALADAWRTVVRRWKTKKSLTAFPYLCVFEATKNGEPHLHILARIDWISVNWLRKLMKKLIAAPVIDVQEIKNQKKVAYYISKYVGKAPHRFATCKRYWTTQDWEVTKFEPEPPPGRWHSAWRIVRTPLNELAAEWRRQGHEIEESKHRILATWRGPPPDVLEAIENIYELRRQGLPW